MKDAGAAGARPEELVRVSERLLSAIVSRDAAVLEELLAPEFAHFDAAGTRTERRDFIAQVLGSTYTVIHAGFESLAVDVVGELAVVNGVQRAEVDLGRGRAGRVARRLHRRLRRDAGGLADPPGALGRPRRGRREE